MESLFAVASDTIDLQKNTLAEALERDLSQPAKELPICFAEERSIINSLFDQKLPDGTVHCKRPGEDGRGVTLGNLSDSAK